uniref:Uncharacterized protein n=1 Tax=Cynoglossus semilaevis TaxID=244447 RepID=A0A3P8WV10_CYNSE
MEPSSPLRCCGNKDETLNLNNDLEKMIEITENITLKLTWMAYDMAAQRTNPEPRILMQNLEEAQSRCRDEEKHWCCLLQFKEFFLSLYQFTDLLSLKQKYFHLFSGKYCLLGY